MITTFEEIESQENGSQFLNADLHVHSFGASHDVRDSTMTVEEIVEAAVRIGINILAITDHNTDANTENAIKYAEKYPDQLFVLAGVEVTTAHGHLLVYFSPEHPERVRDLLVRLEIKGKRGDQDSHTAMSMADVISLAESLGGICVAAHIDRPKTGFDTLAPGFPNWKKDIILSKGLYGLEHDDPAKLVWYSDNDQPGQDGVERTKLFRGRRSVSALAGRPSLAHIQGSDAHRLQDFLKTSGSKIRTRLKMTEPSFDSFRTAMADPDARVRAVAIIPPSIPRIIGMQLTGGFLNDEAYHFSDNLTCFIGGRGTGKSSALQALGHGLGVVDDLHEHGNCPGTVIVYCEDANGIRYKYERLQGAEPTVKAKDDDDVKTVPVDAFRVEYYRQGELAEVAKNPLKTPALLQQFLDRHLTLTVLLERERECVDSLAQNSTQLIPVQSAANKLPEKKRTIEEANSKLEIAEKGKLKDIVSDQVKLSNEKTLRGTLAGIRDRYKVGVLLAEYIEDYDGYVEGTPLTGNPLCEAALNRVRAAIKSANEYLGGVEAEAKKKLGELATEISTALLEMQKAQQGMELEQNGKITALQKQGLQGSVAELQLLLKQKDQITKEINSINTQSTLLKKLRQDRQRMRDELETTRTEMTRRRKEQLASVNASLSQMISDYTVVVHYKNSGIIDEFREFLVEVMRGSFMRTETIEQICSKITPARLAELVYRKAIQEIATETGVDEQWAEIMRKELWSYKSLHALETMWKPPCPVITVKTKGAQVKEIPVNQLSDGQKHTIMLTIAMLAESNVPLVIDQPEDDLDNAFIFSAVVGVLRTIKERRQVVLVTHNANIAVLGDAELILPMKRSGEGGCAYDRGGIDRSETKKAALNILEGGDIAFRRRREIYGVDSKG